MCPRPFRLNPAKRKIECNLDKAYKETTTAMDKTIPRIKPNGISKLLLDREKESDYKQYQISSSNIAVVWIHRDFFLE